LHVNRGAGHLNHVSNVFFRHDVVRFLLLSVCCSVFSTPKAPHVRDCSTAQPRH
jgi:hypothetical protein